LVVYIWHNGCRKINLAYPARDNSLTRLWDGLSV